MVEIIARQFQKRPSHPCTVPGWMDTLPAKREHATNFSTVWMVSSTWLPARPGWCSTQRPASARGPMRLARADAHRRMCSNSPARKWTKPLPWPTPGMPIPTIANSSTCASMGKHPVAMVANWGRLSMMLPNTANGLARFRNGNSFFFNSEKHCFLKRVFSFPLVLIGIRIDWRTPSWMSWKTHQRLRLPPRRGHRRCHVADLPSDRNWKMKRSNK